ncbi:MAG: dicarboxylate/amino acid:cation symporter [Desulfurobacteriaceae bacterium]
MHNKRFLFFMVAGVILGFLVGGYLEDFALATSFIGELFLNALKMVVLPLIIISIANSILNMETINRFKQLGTKILLYYIITTSIAVSIGIFTVVLIKPGEDISLKTEIPFNKEVSFSLHDLIVSLIPPNIFKALTEFDVLPVIVSTILFSLALLSIERERKLKLHSIISELDVALLKLTEWIINFAPVGIFSLIATKIASLGGAKAIVPVIISLSKYVLTVLLALFIHAAIVLPFLYYLLTGKNPYSFVAKVKEALLTAFATASSSATLPITLKSVESAGVKRTIAEFTLPLGATINMDGTALYEAVAVIFLAEAYGMDLSLSHYLIIFLTATLAAIGAAGIPEAGLVTMVLVLQAVGVPQEAVGLILAIDWFLDRCRTSVNVLGDAMGAAIVDRYTKKSF